MRISDIGNVILQNFIDLTHGSLDIYNLHEFRNIVCQGIDCIGDSILGDEISVGLT